MPSSSDYTHFWDDEGSSPRQGVREEEIKVWESRYDVVLPTVLARAFASRNGGTVRGTEMTILPLEEIEPADFDSLRFDDDNYREPRLVFRLGLGTESGGEYLLDFNARGGESSPELYIDYNDGTGATHLSDSFDEYIEELSKDASTPEVIWDGSIFSQTEVARHRLDLSSSFGGMEAYLDQALLRSPEALTLITREVTPGGEIRLKMTLPLPIEGALAMIQPMRPAPHPTAGVHIQPINSEAIVSLESRSNGEGRWINTTTYGVPKYVRFESADREYLESVRSKLLDGTLSRTTDDPALEFLKRAMELKNAARKHGG